VREDDEVVEDDEVKVMEHETTPHYNRRSSVLTCFNNVIM